MAIKKARFTVPCGTLVELIVESDLADGRNVPEGIRNNHEALKGLYKGVKSALDALGRI